MARMQVEMCAWMWLCVFASTSLALGHPGAMVRDVRGMDRRGLGQQECVNSLSCWIATLSFDIPDLSTTQSGFEFSFTSITCDSLSLQDISSSSSIKAGSIAIGLDNLGTECTAHYHVRETAFPHLSGSGDATIRVSKFSMQFTVQFTKRNGLPYNANITQCEEIGTASVSTSFGGSISGDVLSLFTSLINSYIEKELKSLFCSSLTPVLSSTLSREIQSLFVTLERLGNTSVSHPVYSSNILTWDKLSKFSLFKKALKKLATCKNLEYAINSTVGKSININLDSRTSYPLKDGVKNLGNFTLAVNSFVLDGLDTCGTFYLGAPTNPANATAYAQGTLSELLLVLNFSMGAAIAERGATVRGASLDEIVTLELQLSRVSFETDLVIELADDYRKVLESLTLKELTDPKCLLQIIQGLSLQSLKLAQGSLNVDVIKSSPQVLETDIDNLVEGLVNLTLHYFDSEQILGALIEGPLTTELNKQITHLIMEHYTCSPSYSSSNKVVHWPDNEVLKAVDYGVKEILGPEGFNQALKYLHPSGVWTLPISVPRSVLKFLDMTGFKSYVSGLNTFYLLDVFNPVSGNDFELSNEFALGSCHSSASCTPLVFSFEYDTRKGAHTVDLSAFNVLSELDLIVKLNQTALEHYTLSDLTDFCSLLKSMETFRVENLKVNFTDVVIDFDDDVQGGSVSSVVSGLGKTLGASNATAAVNKILEGYVKDCTLNIFTESSGSTLSSSSPDNSLIALFVAVSIFVSMLLVYLISFCAHKPPKSSAKDAAASSRCSKLQWQDALCFHPLIPLWLRLAVPLVICGTGGLFLSSNLSIGASVQIQVNIGSVILTPAPLFKFSLQNTVENMWRAKSAPLAVLVAVLSGIWPYVKLFLMLSAWVCPVRIINLRIRKILLKWLDALGKWSLVDAFVLILLSELFRIHIRIPLGNETVGADVFVIPMYGIYGFLAAAVISLCLTHVIVAAHRLVEESEDKFQARNSENVALFLEYTKSTTWTTRGIWKASLLLLVYTVVGVWLIIGMNLDIMTVDINGLVGLLVGSSAQTSYTLVDIGEKVVVDAGPIEHKNLAGLTFLKAAFFLFGLVIPVVLMAVVMVICFAPMSREMKKRSFAVAEILNAWAAIDVLMVSILASVLEIGLLIQFILGNNCNQIDELLREFLSGVLSDTTCFSTTASFEPGFFVVLVPTFLLYMLVWPVMQVMEGQLYKVIDEESKVILEKSSSDEELNSVISMELAERNTAGNEAKWDGSNNESGNDCVEVHIVQETNPEYVDSPTSTKLSRNVTDPLTDFVGGGVTKQQSGSVIG